MNESEGYVVYFFPQALEALGEAIKPYLREGPGGEHVLCHEIDTAGALLEMTIEALDNEGRASGLDTAAEALGAVKQAARQLDQVLADLLPAAGRPG